MVIFNFFTLVSIYRPLIKKTEYFPQSPSETLCARLTAAYLLNPQVSNSSDEERTQAEAFLRKTSTSPEADLERLSKFVETITAWLQLEIHHSHRVEEKVECEYRFWYYTQSGVFSRHLKATYAQTEQGCVFVHQSPVESPVNPVPRL